MKWGEVIRASDGVTEDMLLSFFYCHLETCRQRKHEENILSLLSLQKMVR